MDEHEDIFHNVVMLEQRSQSEGYIDGFSRGKEEGLVEGYRLGWDKGASLGSEIGFYTGFSEELLKKIGSDPKRRRVCSVLQSIIKIAEDLNYNDPTDQMLFDEVEKIRAKFKQVTSLLGITTEKGKPSTLGGVSF